MFYYFLLFILFIFFFNLFFYFFMGGKNEKGIKYELPLNLNLRNNIQKSIINKNINNEIEKFKKLVHKNVKNDIKKSNFSEIFTNENIQYKNIISLINLIYTKSTNSLLKMRSNRTMYETIFNYDILEKKGESYIKFSKDISNKMKLLISEDRNLDNNSINNMYKNNPEIFETLKMSIQEQNASLSTEKINNTSKMNNYNIDDDILKNHININTTYKNTNLKNNESISNIVSEDQNINSIIQSNSKSNLNIYEETIPISKMNKKERNISKKKHSKEPKKKPIVNIQLDLRDLFKQEVKEKSHLSPSQRYNIRNLNNLKNNKIKDAIDNIESLGAQSLSNRFTNDRDFIDIVDRLSQPNKLENEIIQNRHSINKSKKLKNIKKKK